MTNNYPIVNIFNKKSLIYLFCRLPDGSLKIIKDHSFQPYYFEKDSKGEFKGYDGEKLRKIIVNEPNEIRELRSESAYEADISHSKKYIIDKIDQFEKCPIKWAMIDIEVLHPEDEFPEPKDAKFPISSISIYNSKYNKFRNWFISDYGSDLQKSEERLFVDFVTYLRKAKFDILFGYYMKGFDYPYIYNRFNKLPQSLFFEKESKYENFATAISPIQMVRGSGNREHNLFYPAGTSIIDYLEWIKKLYRGERDESLDGIAEKYLGKGKKLKEVNFSKLSPEIKTRNLEDVQIMVELEQKKFKLIPLFDEMRRMAKISFEDFTYPLRTVDSLFLQEAKIQNIILPSANGEEHKDEEFEGAWRAVFETGLNFDVGKYDISGAYPSAIIDLCIDMANLRDSKEENTIPINITDRETNIVIKTCYMKQNPKGILPQVMRRLSDKKNQFKKLLKELNPETEEYKDTELKYNAVKVLNLAGWGVNGNRYFRYYNTDIASLITSVVRDLLHYLKDETDKQGYKVLFTDTDGLMVADKGKDLSLFLNDLIQKWSIERFKKSSTITIEREGMFLDLFISTMCRYIGHLQTKMGIKEEIKGLAIKRRDSTIFTSIFQKEIFNRIFKKETQEQVVEFIESEIERLKTLPKLEFAIPAKLAMKPELYKTSVTNKKGKTYNKLPPIFVSALKNAQEMLPKFKKRVGEKYWWIYCYNKNKEIIPLAFDEKNQDHIKDICWSKMVRRNILTIIEPIFIGMKWDYKFVPKKVKREKKITEIIEPSIETKEVNLKFLSKPKEIKPYYQE